MAQSHRSTKMGYKRWVERLRGKGGGGRSVLKEREHWKGKRPIHTLLAAAASSSRTTTLAQRGRPASSIAKRKRTEQRNEIPRRFRFARQAEETAVPRMNHGRAKGVKAEEGRATAASRKRAAPHSTDRPRAPSGSCRPPERRPDWADSPLPPSASFYQL